MASPGGAPSADFDCLSPEAQRLAEARLAAKRAARAEAREIRMKELERQQKEIYQVQKKYCGLDSRWGDIERWMEDSERCAHRPRRNASASDDDERVSVASRGSRRTSEPGGHLNSSSRASSRASSARASPVVEERPEKDFAEKGSRNLAGLSAATLASLGGSSSRRGSGDTSISIDTEASIREMKDSLAEAEEKYKKAMVSNAQLDNERTHFMYQVDTLKDTLLDLEEQLAECRRQCEDKSKEFERERHAHSLLRFQFSEVKAALRQRDELLEEVRQLQQKQAGLLREVSDLQETVEWKDRKIGALERQKEFFDSVRSERDELREELGQLKAQLKKHGIVLAADVAANGETPLAPTSVGHAGPTKVTKEELNALTATGAGALGEAPDVERAGRSHLPPRAEGGQHGERPAQGRVDARGRHAEAPDTSGDSAASPAGGQGQGQGQAPEHTALPEPSERGGAAAGTSAPQVPPGGRDDVDGEPMGPASPQGGRRALGPQGPRLDAPAEQEPGGPDLRAASGAASLQPCQAPAGAAAEEPATGGAEAKEPGPGRRVGTAASGPPEGGGGPGSHGGEPAPGTGPGVEAELADQRGPGSRADTEEEEAEGGVAGAGPPAPGGVQGEPCEPSAPASPQAAAAPGPDADHEPLDGGDPEEERSEPQGDGPDPSPRKAKGKKRRNKKKKPPAPAEAPGDAEEPAGQGSGPRGDRAEERAGPAGGSSAEEAQAARSDHSAGPGSPVAPAAELRRPEAGVDAAAASEDNAALPADARARDAGPRDGAARTSAPEGDSPEAAPPEGAEGPEGPEVRSGAESIGLGGGEPAPEGERADAEAEGAEEPGDGKGRAKEDCALS